MIAPLSVTFFPNQKASSKWERSMTLAEIATLIATTKAAAKGELPFIKLALFGDERTQKNCLRHDANVVAITGIETDYDGEKMSFDEAVSIAKSAGLRGILYTSASHTDETPRWRILLPTSEVLPPGRRRGLLAKINGVYGGIFAPESFVLSQAYYYGRVIGRPFRIELVEGGLT